MANYFFFFANTNIIYHLLFEIFTDISFENSFIVPKDNFRVVNSKFEIIIHMSTHSLSLHH